MSIAEKLQTIAENEQRVFDAGYAKGQAEGGGDNYYDTFWDDAQELGARINYRYGFSGYSWTDASFKPKYNIVPSAYNAIYMFISSRVTNLKQTLLDCGVALDLSQVINALSMFEESKVTHIPHLDLGNATILNNIFTKCESLVSVDGINISATAVFSNTSFQGCESLEEIRFEGVLGTNGLNMQWSTKLSKASITSIINALSTTTEGLTVTLSKTAKEAAFTADEWEALEQTKPKWTISLV